MSGMLHTRRTDRVYRLGIRDWAQHVGSNLWWTRVRYADLAAEYGETTTTWEPTQWGPPEVAERLRYQRRFKYAYLPAVDPRAPERRYAHIPVAGGWTPQHNCRCSLRPLISSPEVKIQPKEGPHRMSTASAAVAREEASRLRVPPGTKTVGVRFPGNAQVYHYLSDLDLSVGDEVIVKSPSTGHTVVKVATVDQSVAGVQHAYKWVVGKIDPAAIEAYDARERRAAELKALDAKIERQSKIAQGRVNEQLLAQFDPALAALLAERDAIERPRISATHTIFVDTGGRAGFDYRR